MRREETSAKYLDSVSTHLYIQLSFHFYICWICSFLSLICSLLHHVWWVLWNHKPLFFTTSYFQEAPWSRIFFFLQYFRFGSSLAVVNLWLGKSKQRSVFCAGEGRRRESNEKSWMTTSLSTTAVPSKAGR